MRAISGCLRCLTLVQFLHAFVTANGQIDISQDDVQLESIRFEPADLKTEDLNRLVLQTMPSEQIQSNVPLDMSKLQAIEWQSPYSVGGQLDHKLQTLHDAAEQAQAAADEAAMMASTDEKAANIFNDYYTQYKMAREQSNDLNEKTVTNKMENLNLPHPGDNLELIDFLFKSPINLDASNDYTGNSKQTNGSLDISGKSGNIFFDDVLPGPKSSVIEPTDYIFPSAIPGAENLVICSQEGELHRFWTPEHKCMICSCVRYLSTMTPICVKCDKCDANPGLSPELNQQHPLLQHTKPLLNLQPGQILQPSTPTNTFPLNAFKPDDYLKPMPMITTSNCDPLPTNEIFQNPLKPCEKCICHRVVNVYGKYEARVTCDNNPQCVSTPEMKPISTRDLYAAPFALPPNLNPKLRPPSQSPFDASPAKNQGPVASSTDPRPLLESTPQFPQDILPTANEPVPTWAPTLHPSEKDLMGPLPGPKPHTSCRPYPPNQYFQHPWNVCQKCICQESSVAGVVSVEVNCVTKQDCLCPDFLQPLLPPNQPSSSLNIHPECRFKNIGAMFVRSDNPCRVCSCQSFNKAILPICKTVNTTACLVSNGLVEDITFLDVRCKIRRPNQPFMDGCNVCTCQLIYNYVVARCTPTPDCANAASLNYSKLSYPGTLPLEQRPQISLASNSLGSSLSVGGAYSSLQNPGMSLVQSSISQGVPQSPTISSFKYLSGDVGSQFLLQKPTISPNIYGPSSFPNPSTYMTQGQESNALLQNSNTSPIQVPGYSSSSGSSISQYQQGFHYAIQKPNALSQPVAGSLNQQSLFGGKMLSSKGVLMPQDYIQSYNNILPTQFYQIYPDNNQRLQTSVTTPSVALSFSTQLTKQLPYHLDPSQMFLPRQPLSTGYVSKNIYPLTGTFGAALEKSGDPAQEMKSSSPFRSGAPEDDDDNDADE